MIRVQVNPVLLSWAIKRAGDRGTQFYDRFPHLDDWERGDAQPTLKQLESFARAAYVPVGYLFLPEPPDEKLPIPDLRTVLGRGARHPSPDLLDVVYLCQRRQAWYQDYAESLGEEPKTFVGSVTIKDSPERTAGLMRQQLGFSVAERRGHSSWKESLRRFIEQIEEAGILIMVSGVVGSNNTRVLDPEEFRGFALADTLAPLVFVNGADAKAAQMFTLAHELAHIWLGQSAVSDVTMSNDQRTEVWCNRVAAEMLVPLAELRTELGKDDPMDALGRLTRAFKVSSLVMLRRLLDAKAITRAEFDAAYAAEMYRISSRARSGGGDFYLTQGVRLSRRFARAIITSALEGQTLFRDAFQMLGVSKEQTFRELGRKLRVIP